KFAPFSHDAATAYVASIVSSAVVPLSEVSSIPEPELLLLLMLALVGIGCSRKRSFKTSGMQQNAAVSIEYAKKSHKPVWLYAGSFACQSPAPVQGGPWRIRSSDFAHSDPCP